MASPALTGQDLVPLGIGALALKDDEQLFVAAMVVARIAGLARRHDHVLHAELVGADGTAHPRREGLEPAFDVMLGLQLKNVGDRLVGHFAPSSPSQ